MGRNKNENRIHHPVTVTDKRAYATARPGLYGSSLMGTGYIDGRKKADRMPLCSDPFRSPFILGARTLYNRWGMDKEMK